jgi:O-antigen ligase
MVVSYPWLIGRDVAGQMARQSLTIRMELAKTGLRVIATRPLFGVGIDRFFLSAGSLASPELHAMWPARKNPHNDFIRVGAELGLVALGLFVWILAGAGRRIWQTLQRTRDARLAGLAGGLVAFLITSPPHPHGARRPHVF